MGRTKVSAPVVRLLASLLVTLALAACEPVPDDVLSPDEVAVGTDLSSIVITYTGTGDDASSVRADLVLPLAGASGTTIAWSSSNPDLVSTAGVVTRPYWDWIGSATVTLTAEVSRGTASGTRDFPLTVEMHPHYLLGDTGPAGGTIIYENAGHAVDGWRYLEADASWMDGGTYRWSSVQDTAVGTTVDGFGKGLDNTALIVAQAGCTEGAALACAGHSVDHLGKTFDDWYLPSDAELRQFKTALFLNWGAWWSSVESSSTEALLCNLGTEPDPTTTSTGKSAFSTVWAIRRF